MLHSRKSWIILIILLTLISSIVAFFIVWKTMPEPMNPIQDESQVSTVNPDGNPSMLGDFPQNINTDGNTIYDKLSSNYIHRYDKSAYHIFYGIDISEWNNDGSIDWNQIKNSGIEFAFIRVALRGYGDAGILKEDSCFNENITNAINCGIKVGSYIYSQATTVEEAEEEAELILSCVKNYPIDLPIVMDCEFASAEAGFGRLYKAGLSALEYSNVCNAFCSKISEAGYTPMIYANRKMLAHNIDLEVLNDDILIWVAQYNDVCEFISSDYSFWQFTDSGKVPGMEKDCDLNFWYVEKSSVLDEMGSISIDRAIQNLKAGTGNPHTILNKDDPYRDFVAYAYKAGLMMDEEASFVGDDNAKVSDMLYALYKISQSTDVPEDWMKSVGLSNGIEDGDEILTYGTAAHLLYRYITECSEKVWEKESTSTERGTSAEHRCMIWLADRDIYFSHLMNPNEPMSRYEFVVLLVDFYKDTK